MAKKILAIDDESELLEVLEQLLEGEGYDVVTAPNGVKGIEMAKEHDPDLIILDIAMPKMDGIETLSRLRGQRETSTIPVVMLTAKGSTDNIMQADRHRAVEFLIKPFPSDELTGVIRRCIR